MPPRRSSGCSPGATSASSWSRSTEPEDAMHELSGKVAVITGAASGFGREFARLGASLGMRLALADLEADALAGVVDELRDGGAEVFGETVDVRRGEDVERLAERTIERFGASHVLFNNAGVAAGGLLWEATERDWQWVL